MAKLMVIGRVAQVEILTDPEDEDLMLAKCRMHPSVKAYGCDWEDRHDTMNDAVENASVHADGVR